MQSRPHQTKARTRATAQHHTTAGAVGKEKKHKFVAVRLYCMWMVRLEGWGGRTGC